MMEAGGMRAKFDSTLAVVRHMSPAERAQMAFDAVRLGGDLVWVPNPGPQTDAYYCEADVLLYGGTAGCGKSGLLCGLSLTAHRRSLFLRRTNKEAKKIRDAYESILGHSEGWNGQESYWRFPDGRLIQTGGCQMEDSKQDYKGTPYDFYAFDEICDFTQTQFEFIIAWNRSTDPGQRCRVVCASNPPTTPEGMWVVKYWAPWLDPRHPNPAKPGELRWFLGGKEVDGPGPHMLDGIPTRALSRTFIPGELGDNPDLAQTNYDATLGALPEELRQAYRLGRFDCVVKDGAFQVIPTEWVNAAFARWSPAVPRDVPMSAIAVDIAQGGEDDTIIAYRYGPYYAKLVRKPGHTTPDGSSIAGLIASHRRDNAKIVLDMTGGYGGGAYEVLRGNEIDCHAFKGHEGSRARTRDGQFAFLNRRAEVYWKFREALDPEQPGGSQIALPESQELLLDLVTPKWKVGTQGIQITPKETVRELLGRSPDAGDAVVTCWSQGDKEYKASMIFNHEEHGLSRQRSNIVDLGPRRNASIVSTRRG